MVSLLWPHQRVVYLSAHGRANPVLHWSRKSFQAKYINDKRIGWSLKNQSSMQATLLWLCSHSPPLLEFIKRASPGMGLLFMYGTYGSLSASHKHNVSICFVSFKWVCTSPGCPHSQHPTSQDASVDHEREENRAGATTDGEIFKLLKTYKKLYTDLVVSVSVR